jgi:glycine C-acetyltransferase
VPPDQERRKMADKLSFIDEEMAALKDGGLLINIRTIESPQGASLIVNGKQVLNFCSNNYLGLASHPRLRDAAKKAIDQYGVGPGAVRTIAGNMSLHNQLEERLARFKGVEAAIAVQSGFNANQAVIPALAGRGDLIISDELNHASIIDGVRLTKADRAIFKHRDANDLRRVLGEAEGKYGKMLIVTDGVFSMDGDVAPLDEITDAAEEAGAITIVDDAHGEGVLGHGGRGIVDHFGVHGRFDIEVGTMSKAFGVVGGYVAGRKKLVDYLRQKARPFLFSSAMTVPDTAACIAAVDLLEETTEFVDRLWSNTEIFKTGMAELGFDTGESVTPIVPVMLGEAQLAQEFSRRLFEEGVFAMAIGYPTVPRGKARIRVMISAGHSADDLKRGIAAFESVGKELGVIS